MTNDVQTYRVVYNPSVTMNNVNEHILNTLNFKLVLLRILLIEFECMSLDVVTSTCQIFN